MSCHALLSLHLDDYVTLVEQLFDSFDPAVTGLGHAAASAGGSVSAAAAAASAASAHASTEAVMSRLIRKDQLLQGAVDQLLEHQALDRALREKRAEVAQLDQQLVAFCGKLGALEHALLECSAEEPGLVRGLGDTRHRAQQFRARDVSIFASKLARMSFAPADHLERKALLHESVTRPPAPLEKLMAGSMLHLTAEELTRLLDAEDKAKLELEEAQKAGLQAMSDSHGDHAIAAAHSQMPGSLAALGRQDSLQVNQSGALPSFAELAQGAASSAAAGATGTPVQPTHMWRQESAHRNAAIAPVALDLDLESSSSDDDDDD